MTTGPGGERLLTDASDEVATQFRYIRTVLVDAAGGDWIVEVDREPVDRDDDIAGKTRLAFLVPDRPQWDIDLPNEVLVRIAQQIGNL
ncbi:hypothetical protein [Virgisporangium aurantiacum]|uniref:Uncharacterized protein n=1 Tax=Virgisporangium aurantiacum TaxID=175570 RepID=A0A8J3ZFV9_9ACTN|nr:hypothetical protein [Virgisporangium aurantiacum]GIJ62122.1 hypothetical protein Vau01_096380 [Virgisporangium aurantiacum]